jgi:mRNA-degrading endonuclease toxin of MazEF toxin-antitoxin module
LPDNKSIERLALGVPLPKGVGVTGCVFTNQFRSLDWLARHAEHRSRVNDDMMDEVLGRIEAILSRTTT